MRYECDAILTSVLDSNDFPSVLGLLLHESGIFSQGNCGTSQGCHSLCMSFRLYFFFPSQVKSLLFLNWVIVLSWLRSVSQKSGRRWLVITANGRMSNGKRDMGNAGSKPGKSSGDIQYMNGIVVEMAQSQAKACHKDEESTSSANAVQKAKVFSHNAINSPVWCPPHGLVG